MLTVEVIQHETVWVGKFNDGGRISGTWDEIGHIDESEFRDLDIACAEHQSEVLREFYESYFNQKEYYNVFEYFENVYSKEVHHDC